MSHSIPSNALEAAIRTHFGLTQAELGRYLGVSERQIAHLEAGRRRASLQANRRLERLARLLPPPEGTGPSAPAFSGLAGPEAPAALPTGLPEFGPLAPAPVRKRQRQVAAQAAALRWALHRAGKRAALQHRRQWGLGQLQAAPAAGFPDAAELAHFTRWLQVLAADVAAAVPGPAAVARQVLAVVRLHALDSETAALARLLPPAPVRQPRQ
ncbi:transcriptional regulator with XRE-family HTH domain [Hymenobacter sp. UYAg731]